MSKTLEESKSGVVSQRGSVASSSKERKSSSKTTRERLTSKDKATSREKQDLKSSEKVPKASYLDPNDAVNAEFIYYSAVLRNYAPILTKDFDKKMAYRWMRKLFKAEYHSSVLRPKRNKFLLYLTITIYNDEVFGIFKQEPPGYLLPDITKIKLEAEFPPAAWETETQWKETIDDLPDEIKMSDCYLHTSDCPQAAGNLKTVYDLEFQFFLWLAKPYVALIGDPEDKTMIACWIQLLCGIAPQAEDCVEMKQLRNEYMQALLGYIHDLRVEGPFRLMPPAGPLPPLSLLYETCDESDFSKTMSKKADEFLASQPLPDSGAFAYINVTGKLFGST